MQFGRNVGKLKDIRPCRTPSIAHGRVRLRQKGRLAQFTCFPMYTLVGNKYATCFHGIWDEPVPVCIRSGCTLPTLDTNLLPMSSHNDAWVTFFCLPGFELVGSTSIFCDGRQWNSSIPKCVPTKKQSPLSCDFEDGLCGWIQDELHDFDWRKLNKKTPSYFLFTGPSYDHTYGPNGSGYYMYIESTSRLENDTARLISPVYDAALSKNGCFQFYYHMYGQAIGGLRVYQKPESFSMLNLVQLNSTKMQKYILFELWGNQGDKWYDAVPMLFDFSDSFQIIIEGIRGRSYTSDIAIDDVAILQGGNCTSAQRFATTPAGIIPDSCAGRCDIFGTTKTVVGCGCTVQCELDSNCCPDFYELCVFDSTTEELPVTQKLVAPSTVIPVTSSPATSPTTTTGKPTTTSRPTTKTTRAPKATTTTTKRPPATFSTSPKPVSNRTTRAYTTPPPKPVSKTTPVTTKVVATTKKEIEWKSTTVAKAYTKQPSVFSKDMLVNTDESKDTRSGLKTAILTITGLVCLAGLIWLVALSRGARCQLMLRRLRGRALSDPEVRYLNSDVDDQ